MEIILVRGEYKLVIDASMKHSAMEWFDEAWFEIAATHLPSQTESVINSVNHVLSNVAGDAYEENEARFDETPWQATDGAELLAWVGRAVTMLEGDEILAALDEDRREGGWRPLVDETGCWCGQNIGHVGQCPNADCADVVCESVECAEHDCGAALAADGDDDDEDADEDAVVKKIQPPTFAMLLTDYGEKDVFFPAGQLVVVLDADAPAARQHSVSPLGSDDIFVMRQTALQKFPPGWAGVHCPQCGDELAQIREVHRSIAGIDYEEQHCWCLECDVRLLAKRDSFDHQVQVSVCD